MLFPGGERGLEPGPLPVGEVLLAGAQDVADPIERVAPAAAVVGGVLLHAPSDVVDDLGGQLDDMERVQYRAGVLQLVVDRVLVPVERVEGGDLHASCERLTTLLQPCTVRLAGPSWNEVQQPGPGVAIGVSGEVDHPSQLLRAPTAVLDRLGRHVMPHVLIHAEDRHALEAGLLVGRSLQQRQNRLPDRAPTGAQQTT